MSIYSIYRQCLYILYTDNVYIYSIYRQCLYRQHILIPIHQQSAIFDSLCLSRFPNFFIEEKLFDAKSVVYLILSSN